MADEHSHLTVSMKDSVHIAEFADRKILEELSITEIEQELMSVVDGQANIQLLVSFTNVEHLSSAALGMLIKLNSKVEELGGTLRLSDITPQIFEVFKITGLNKLFKIHESKDQAIAAFS